MASIEIKEIDKHYQATAVLKQVSLSVKDGEFMTLVGPSGCGKSTLLRVIAGLEAQSAGDIKIDGVSISGVRPSDRNLSMVFQSYALYPHLSVFDNIAVPLRMRHHTRLQRLPLIRWLIPGTRNNERKIAEQVKETAATLGLGDLLGRKPGELSGGQRQRVAVGRAIVRDPEAFLLDEPLSNLDAKMRVHMRTELTQLHRRLQATFVYVTHDQAEAMTMSTRIAVMMDGEIIQIGTPDEVYHRPVDIRVAEFIGSPKINILPASSEDHGRVSILGQQTSLGCSASISSVGIRPEACRIASSTGDEAGSLSCQGVASHVENFGAEIFIHLEVPDMPDLLVIRSEAGSARSIATGDKLTVDLDLKQMLAFDGSGKAVDYVAGVDVTAVSSSQPGDTSSVVVTEVLRR